MKKIASLVGSMLGRVLACIVSRDGRLCVAGSWMGEMTGSVLWADVEEHSMSAAPKSYGMNRVFQVFGHTRLNPQYDMLSSEYMAMIDSRQAFMIDEASDEKIAPLKNYRLS